MKEIILKATNPEVIYADQVRQGDAVLAVSGDGQIKGMIIKEEGKFILRFPNGCGSSGHHTTLIDCIKAAKSYGYKFYTDITL